MKQAVAKNGGDANATDGDGGTAGSNANATNGGALNSSSSSSKVTGVSDVKAGKQTTSGSVRNVALQNNQYGAYWGSYNGTQAFFERGGNLFAQQAKGVVDVSEWQYTIDWQAAKNSGVEGAIIRIGLAGAIATITRPSATSTSASVWASRSVSISIRMQPTAVTPTPKAMTW